MCACLAVLDTCTCLVGVVLEEWLGLNRMEEWACLPAELECVCLIDMELWGCLVGRAGCACLVGVEVCVCLAGTELRLGVDLAVSACEGAARHSE